MKKVLFHILAIGLSLALGGALFWLVTLLIPGPGDANLQSAPKLEHYQHEKVSNNKERTKMVVDGEVIMDFKFERSPIHPAMRHIPPTPGPHDRHLVLLGGSFAWSAGTADNQTIHHHLQTMDPSLEVKNFSFEGLGPSSILRFFQKNPDWHKHVQNKNGASVYIFIPDHIGRVSGDLFHMGDMYENAYYYLDANEKLVYGGSFIHGRPLLTRVLRFLAGIELFRRFEINYPDPKSPGVQKLFCHVVKELKREVEYKLKSSLFFAFFGAASYDEKMAMNCLASSGVGSFILQHPENVPDEQLYVPYDGHPNGVLNKHVARQILDHTDRELKRMESSSQE